MRIWLATSLIGLTVGCGGIWVPHRDVARTLGVGDVTGRWVLTSDSHRVAERHGLKPRGEPYTVTFRPDGTLVFDAVFDRTGVPEPFKGSGRWALLHDTTGDSNLAYRNLVRVDLTDRQFHLQFDERDGRLVLWQCLGDPDQWDFLEYEQDR